MEGKAIYNKKTVVLYCILIALTWLVLVFHLLKPCASDTGTMEVTNKSGIDTNNVKTGGEKVIHLKGFRGMFFLITVSEERFTNKKRQA